MATNQITERVLLDRITQIGGFANRDEADAALKATLYVLGERLPTDERKKVADALPLHASRLLQARKYRGPFDTAEFFDRVRRHEGVNLGFAHEHAQVVCQALGEILADDTHRVLADVLPDSLAELFEPPNRSSFAPEPQHAHAGTHHTLATGKPGSSHPLSEAAPPGAQRHSVVREANPHGETKLSSSAGFTQERLDESFATNEPDTRRTIAERHD